MNNVGHPTTPHVERCIRAWCKQDEDLIQVARIAAWQASLTHDPTKGLLESWLVKAIRHRLIDEWRIRSRATRRGVAWAYFDEEDHPARAESPTDLWERVPPALVRIHVIGEEYKDVGRDSGSSAATMWNRARRLEAKFRNKYPQDRPSTP